MASNKIPETKNQKKILIIGLQKSGKTSIILSLEGDTNLMSYYNLKPTPGLNIKSLPNEGFEYVLWELGGQELYRDKYFENFTRYSDQTGKIIYVIDVQDHDNYKKALDYLNKILIQFSDIGVFPEVSIFLHKYDPSIRILPEYSNEKIIENLIDPIRKIIPGTFNYEIYKTTIFTIFRKEPFS